MNTENQKTLHQVLKEQTMVLHKKAHGIQYISNLLNNNVQLRCYVGHIKSLTIIYGALEQQLFNVNNETIQAILYNYKRRLPDLLTDLDYLRSLEDMGEIEPVIHQAKHVADKVLKYCKLYPYKLLGFIYTLEGSLNGGSILKKHLSKVFNFKNNDGTLYLSSFDEQFKNFWTDFINRLNTVLTDELQKNDVVSGSYELFIDLMKIYELLSPVKEEVPEVR